tara:strand:+ start:1396 stop:2172 length:777 start_codon:yes stop_codon:yes gene_type:complete
MIPHFVNAESVSANGILQFDMKIVIPPTADKSKFTWNLKVEAGNASSSTGDYLLANSNEKEEPVAGKWQTYTFNLSDLQYAGLDINKIDVILIFPSWGMGEGAVYRIDNLRIYDPTAIAGTPSIKDVVLFKDKIAMGWVVWDCCSHTTPTVEDDSELHNKVAQFVIGETPTVMGFNSRVEFINNNSSVESKSATEAVRHPNKFEYLKIISKSNHFQTCYIESDDGFYGFNLYPKKSSSYYPVSAVFKYTCRIRHHKYI